jgi:hypothetical protein
MEVIVKRQVSGFPYDGLMELRVNSPGSLIPCSKKFPEVDFLREEMGWNSFNPPGLRRLNRLERIFEPTKLADFRIVE